MCLEKFVPEMTGLHVHQSTLLALEAPRQTPVIEAAFGALTHDLNPHLPVLPAIIAMAEAVQDRDFGVLSEHGLVRLPLSIIGSDKVRYRTPIVEMLHESVLSLRMSDITVDNLRKALKPFDLCVLFLCSCGVVMGRCADVRAFYGSDTHRRMDRLRSAIDAEGNPVVEVASFDDIKVPSMDLHVSGAEVRLFNRIEYLTKIGATEDLASYPWLDAELAEFVRKSAIPLWQNEDIALMRAERGSAMPAAA